MAQYSGVNKQGKSFTFEASSSSEALKNPLLASNSGVQLMKTPTNNSSSSNTTTTKATKVAKETGAGANQLIQSITDRLLKSDAVTSANTAEIDKRIKSAISGIESSNQFNTERIDSQYDRLINRAEQQGQFATGQALEGRRGFATNIVGLRELVRTTDENIKDLQQRREELVLSGNAEAAQQIANLELQQLQFKQEAQQRTFSNLLGLGNLAVSVQQNERLQEQQDFSQMIERVGFLADNNLLGDLSPENKAEIEQQFDLPSGVLDNIKKKEDLNLQIVSGVGLVNVTQDENGKPKTEVLVRSKTTSGTTPTISRETQISQYLSSLTGDDGYVAPETYESAKNSYIAQGGTLREFFRDFPANLYLSGGSIEFLGNAATGTGDTSYDSLID